MKRAVDQVICIKNSKQDLNWNIKFDHTNKKTNELKITKELGALPLAKERGCEALFYKI